MSFKLQQFPPQTSTRSVRARVRWVDLEVVRETSGRPTLAITGEAAKIARELGVKSVALSITHTESQALAQVIFEG